MKRFANPDQLTIFELLKDYRPQNTEFTIINMDLFLRDVLTKAIKESAHSRYQIAARMSELLRTEITKTMIDAWTAESREGLNMIPACRLPALMIALETGTIEPLKVLADPLGAVVLQGEQALDLELKRIEDQEKKLSEKKKAIKAIKGMARK
jgi:hypothetical protein